MSLPFDPGAERFALLLGLSLFFGFAFEEFYAGELPNRPGGVRTFPLLALAGAALYQLDPTHVAAFAGGLLVLGAWIFPFVREQTARAGATTEGLLIVPLCNALAYALGAIALTQPLWMPVSATVAAVLLLSGRRSLHELAARVEGVEIRRAAQFLILVGIVLPLLYGLPPIPHTSITPYGVWLAVVAVSTISYAGYLLGTYVMPRYGTIVTALVGGLYSSTSTTVVLARRARDEGMTAELGAGILAATAVMYVRIVVVCGIFSLPLARALLLPLGIACALALAAAWFGSRRGARHTPSTAVASNPLQLTTALLFAGLMVLMSLVTGYVDRAFGSAGVTVLAAVVGFTDIDPFVLGIAQGGVASLGLHVAAVAIAIATASNNVTKAVFTLWFARGRESWIPAAMLAGLALITIPLAAFIP